MVESDSKKVYLRDVTWWWLFLIKCSWRFRHYFQVKQLLFFFIYLFSYLRNAVELVFNYARLLSNFGFETVNKTNGVVHVYNSSLILKYYRHVSYIRMIGTFTPNRFTLNVSPPTFRLLLIAWYYIGTYFMYVHTCMGRNGQGPNGGGKTY